MDKDLVLNPSRDQIWTWVQASDMILFLLERFFLLEGTPSFFLFEWVLFLLECGLFLLEWRVFFTRTVFNMTKIFQHFMGFSAPRSHTMYQPTNDAQNNNSSSNNPSLQKNKEKRTTNNTTTPQHHNKQPRPPDRPSGLTRRMQRTQSVHFGAALQTPSKFHEKTPEREKQSGI